MQAHPNKSIQRPAEKGDWFMQGNQVPEADKARVLVSNLLVWLVLNQLLI